MNTATKLATALLALACIAAVVTSQPTAAYQVFYTPGAGCVLFGANDDGNAVVAVGTLTAFVSPLASSLSYTCFFNTVTSLARIPAGAGPTNPLRALVPSDFRTLQGLVSCFYFTYTKSNPSKPVTPGGVNGDDTTGGNWDTVNVITRAPQQFLVGALGQTMTVRCVTPNNIPAGANVQVLANDGDLNICFPSWATVQTPSGPKPMSELTIGDTVLALDAAGKPFWDVVYFLPHKDASKLGHYLTLHAQPLADAAAATHKMVLSKAHYLTVKCSSEGDGAEGGNKCLRLAAHVEEGDTVWLADAATSKEAAVEAKVVKVTKSLEWGAYSPWTLSGSIVVDGVEAATNTLWPGEWTILNTLPKSLRLAAAHKAAAAHHLLLAPLRAVYRVAGPGPLKQLNRVVDYFMGQGDFAPAATAKASGAQLLPPAWELGADQVAALISTAAAASGPQLTLPAGASAIVY